VEQHDRLAGARLSHVHPKSREIDESVFDAVQVRKLCAGLSLLHDTVLTLTL
jgi:hypothetical protein